MATRRLELGFEGGTVLRLTVDASIAADIPGALFSGEGPWAHIVAEEGAYWIDRDDLVYVRLPPGEVHGRVGFSGS